MKRVLAILISLMMLSAEAYGQSQGAVKQSGSVTSKHLSMWSTSGVIMDAGTAAGGKAGINPTTLGITATGTPFCITDNPTTSPYHQLCFGANSLGGGLISYQAYNGAVPLPMNCNINGTVISNCLVGGGGGGLPPGGPSLSLQYNNGGVFGGYVVGSEFSVAGGTFNVMAFTGDVTKPLGSVATTVVALQGHPVSTTAPTTGQCLGWNGVSWGPTACGGGGSGITQLTGPVTAGPGSGSQAATITPTGVAAGSYTLASTGGTSFCTTFNPAGQATSIVSGTCGGGGVSLVARNGGGTVGRNGGGSVKRN